ncbi:MAG: hypothetical protein ACT4N8_01085 [Sphingosinicella sp.]|uniref:hypothetical protein n=1 Tax=Sphingosinicella sp. TaxID=1917971 RepID=UPI004037E971
MTIAESPTRRLLGLLSVSIGAVMEDEAAEAILALPKDPEARFARLKDAGQDIETLADAALAVLRRGLEI